MSRGFWAAFWAVLFSLVILPIAAVGLLAWYGAARDKCEAAGGTLLMSQPLQPVCIKLQRIPLT